jgi:hypothetical protein
MGMGIVGILVSQADTAVLAGLILYCYNHVRVVEDKIKILEERLSDLELVVSEQ